MADPPEPPLNYAKPESKQVRTWERTWEEIILYGVSGIISVPFLFLGVGWIYVFGFTDHRPHHAHIGVPAGIISLCIGILVNLNAWRWSRRR